MGAAPDWYVLLRAARYLGVAPWALAEQPVTWREFALAAERAEGLAQQKANERARQKAKR